jgi:hypothetical protein
MMREAYDEEILAQASQAGESMTFDEIMAEAFSEEHLP